MPITVNDYTALLAYTDSSPSRWNALTTPGSSVVVTYNFTTGADLPDDPTAPATGPYGTTSYQAFNAEQQSIMRGVIDKAQAVSGVIFVEVDGPAMLNMYSALGAAGISGFANYGQGLDNYTNSADLRMVYQNFNNAFTYQILLHELGHTLGLKHPHSGSVQLEEAADFAANTVMTYNIAAPYEDDFGVLDIAAFEHLYGGAGATAGFQILSAFGDPIVLRASNRDDRVVSTDEGAEIQGRGGNDELTGRQGADLLLGQAGNDLLKGGYGMDILRGGNGADTIIGDIGSAFTGAGDTIAGHAGDDTINGNAGNDRILGGSGNDLIFGENDDDFIIGGAGNDTIDGGNGSDRLIGGAGRDTIIGGDGNDRSTGGADADTFVMTDADRFDTEDIFDFEVGIDTIDLSALSVTADDLVITGYGNRTEIYVTGHWLTINLRRVDADDLDLNDFVFDVPLIG